MDSIFTQTNLSIKNYDSMLTSWVTQAVQNGVRMGASTQYSKTAEAARGILIDEYNSIIKDDGMVRE